MSGALTGTATSDTTSGLILSGTNGPGVLDLTGTNTYKGATTINSGATLEAGGSGSVSSLSGSLNNTSGVTVNSGGTLLFGTSDQINHSATVALSGGTLAVARTGSSNSLQGNVETMGALTLSARSTIDFGSGTSGDHNELIFSTFSAPGTVLTVSDWLAGSTYSQSSPSDTGSNDELLFGTGNGSYSLSTGQLAEIQFYVNGSEYQAIQFNYNGYDEVAPGTVVVPEPSTVFAALCLLGLLGWRGRRRFQELVGRSMVTFQTSSFGYKGPHF
jgi:autotransporter-associated beta strand protein